MIERRVRDQNRRLSVVSISLCIAGILAIAFAISIRVMQTTLISDQILMHIKLTPHFFDRLHAAYQYTLIATLVLSGLIVDLIGPRTVLIIAVGSAIFSNFLFHNAVTMQIFMASRFLTEFSYVFILTSVLTLGSHWLPRRYFSFFIGLVFGTFLLTPVLVKTPLAALIQSKGMPQTDFVINLIGIIIMLIIFRTKTTPDYSRRRTHIYSHFNPLRYYKIWLIALVAMTGWMTNIFIVQIFAYFLIGAQQLDLDHALKIINNSYNCFGVGVIIMGIVADFIYKKRHIIAWSYCVAAGALCGILFIADLSILCISILMYIAAFFASSGIICYTKSNDYCTVENSGITVGLVLSISTIGSSLFIKTLHQSLVSFANTGVDQWTPLFIMPVLLLIAAIIALSLTPTHAHKPHHSS